LGGLSFFFFKVNEEKIGDETNGCGLRFSKPKPMLPINNLVFSLEIHLNIRQHQQLLSAAFVAFVEFVVVPQHGRCHSQNLASHWQVFVQDNKFRRLR